MNLIKKIFTIFVILGFFVALLAISQTINPQPVSAASCSLIFATSGPPIVGKSITATIKDTIPGGSYGVDLRRIGFGSVDNQHKTATGSSLSFTIDGSKITVAGDYQFESLRTDIVENCIDPPVFTVEPAPSCSLIFATSGPPIVGKSITATIKDTIPGGSYGVDLRRIGFGSVDNQHKTATGSSLSFTIDGSKITVAGDYQFESLRTDIVENCIDPPVFTVDVGMADCILKSKDMGGNVGEPVSFWLT